MTADVLSDAQEGSSFIDKIHDHFTNALSGMNPTSLVPTDSSSVWYMSQGNLGEPAASAGDRKEALTNRGTP